MKNNTLELKFNKKIYKKEVIKKSIQAFSHLAEFSVGAKDSYFIVGIKANDDIDEDVLRDEFANYCLYSMKNV